MSRHDKYHKEYCENTVNYPVGGQYHHPHQKLAEATVPYQVYGQIWEPKTGLKAGTIFPDLYRPYEGKMC